MLCKRHMKQLIHTSFDSFYKINEFVARTTPMRTHYNSKNRIERWLWQTKKQVIKNMLRGISYTDVLDVGCGDGGLLEVVSRDSSYTGIDISPTQLASFRKILRKNKRKKVHLIRGDITKLPFERAAFDVALVCDVVEHVLSPTKVLAEVGRVVKEGGYIIFSIPNERLLQLARLLTFRFPLRSPDHLYALRVNDVSRYFPKVVKYEGIPVPFSQGLSLINILLVQND